MSVIKLCYQASLPIVKTVKLMYLLSIWLGYTNIISTLSLRLSKRSGAENTISGRRFNSDSSPPRFVCLCLELVNMISLKQSYNYTSSNYSTHNRKAGNKTSLSETCPCPSRVHVSNIFIQLTLYHSLYFTVCLVTFTSLYL